MTALAFICLARHAGSTFADLARDIAAAARPGDHVLILDDSGDEATAPRIGRFLAEEGWPPGVTGEAIVTGGAGTGDLGVAVNLALAALSVPGRRPAGPHHLLFLAAGSRIGAGALDPLRDLLAGHDLVLLPWRQWSLDLGRPVAAPEAEVWPARPGEDTRARALRLAPPLQGLVAAHGLIAGLRADEGRGSHGDLALVRRLLTRAEAPAIVETPAGHRPHPPDPGPELIAAAADLVAADPAAGPWVAAHLPRWCAGLTPGGRGAILTQGPALLAGRDDLPEGLPAALARGDRRAAAAALPRPAPPAPPVLGRARLRLHLAGETGHTPFARPALAPLWEESAGTVADPGSADLILWAHPGDPARAPDLSPGRHVLFSDDPLAAALGPDPLARQVTLPGPRGGTLSLHQVTHHRSPVFSGGRLPYPLLARPGRTAALAEALVRSAQLPPDARAAGFDPGPEPAIPCDIARPEGDLFGLTGARARLVAALSDRLPPAAPGGPARFALALETIHQPAHLSERFFGALARGALPLYVASPGHRLHDLGLPEAAWINLWGMEPEAAAEILARRDFDPGALARAQAMLAALCADPGTLAEERARLGRALVAELGRLADLPPA